MRLGAGMEGVVALEAGIVCKRFHPGRPVDAHVGWLREVLRGTSPFLPEPAWRKEAGGWIASYPWFDSAPVHVLPLEPLREFFLFCLRQRLVCPNIKLANFRLRPDGTLTFIDVGSDVLRMNVDYFRDSCARGFALSALGWSDEELRQRSMQLRAPTEKLAEASYSALPGFAAFYHSLLQAHAARQWATVPPMVWPTTFPVEPRVSLLIKACAMEATTLGEQVRHLVGQLSRPHGFFERVLVIDPFAGPFLRQHCAGDLPQLLAEAERLRQEGWLDRVIVAPDDAAGVSRINQRWFGLASPHARCVRGIPVSPQVWAFEQMRTPYVLQCDADVMVGRRDFAHDYLAEMLAAAQPAGVLGVAFNIPHDPALGFRPYAAPAGGYVPEVRCGLLDLVRVFGCRPLPNSLADGRLTLSWYRSLQRHQQAHGGQTLRGGDPRTFYVHPPNAAKSDHAALARVRDLVAQGCVPEIQFGRWDLCGTEEHWRFPTRSEPVVILLKGRNTPPERLLRCLRSLAMQGEQSFGMIVIDDASDSLNPQVLAELLAPWRARCTLLRRATRQGRLPNILTAIREICTNPDTLVVVLDLDDALIHPGAISRLREACAAGADVVLGAMFRPDKPLKLYHPDFVAPRTKWGGEVWIHLRSFRKRLFDAITVDAFQLDHGWIEHCTDYAVMLPLVELSRQPVYLPEYLYLHERSTLSTPELRVEKDRIIARILSKPSPTPKIGLVIPEPMHPNHKRT